MKSAEIAESFLIKELPAQVTHLTGVMTCDSHAHDDGDNHSVAVGKGRGAPGGGRHGRGRRGS